MRSTMSVIAMQNSSWSNGRAGRGISVSAIAIGMVLARMNTPLTHTKGAAASPLIARGTFPPRLGQKRAALDAIMPVVQLENKASGN